MSRELFALPGLRRALGLSTLLSAAGLLGTVLTWTTAAQLITQALLHRAAPEGRGLALVVAGLLLRGLAQAAREHGNVRFAARAVRHWRDLGTRAALRLGPVALASERGSDVGLLTGDLDARLTPYYARYLPQAAHAGVAAVIMLAATLQLDAPTALILALTGPLTVVFLALVGLAAQAETEKQWLAHTRLGARLVSLVRHLPTLHAFGAVAPYQDVLTRCAAAHRVSTLKVLRVAFLSGFVMDLAATLSTALAAVWIGVRLFEGHAQLAPTLAALTLVPEFFGPLRQLGADRHAALDAGPVAARLRALLGMHSAPSGEAAPAARVPQLSFTAARADVQAVTAPLSLDVPPGTHLALTGASGSGKTSLLHALRKHVPHTGQINVDGTALDALNAAAWQAQVAYVPQQPRLLAASVRENMRLLKPQATDAEVLEAARAVGLYEVLVRLPGGLDALLGEGGVLLSGGETARLGLARALLSGSGLVLLDEVTAHLDDDTALEVETVIRRAFAGRTVMMATHRAVPAGFAAAHLTPAGTAA